MNEEIIIPTQEKVNNKEVLDESAEKLAVIASKLAEIFKAGYDAGFIGAKTTALLEAYKKEAIDYIDRQIDHIVTGKDSDGVLETIAEISAALNNDANAFATLVGKIDTAKAEAMAEAQSKVPIKKSTSGYSQIYGTTKDGNVALWDIYQTITSDNDAVTWRDLLLNSIVTRDSTDGYAYTITPPDDGNDGKNGMRIPNVKYVLGKTSEALSDAQKYTDAAVGQAKTDAQKYTDDSISDLINGAPEALDTLLEISNALKEDDNAIGALTSTIAANKTIVEAALEPIFGGCTLGLAYSYDEDGNYVCSGMGVATATEITIPSKIVTAPVLSIGNRAFAQRHNITKVTITKGITSIGDEAFSTDLNLTYVSIPKSITTIGCEAFAYCNKLKSVAIPSGATIGQRAFLECTGLESIHISELSTIGTAAFSDCTGITDIYYDSDEDSWNSFISGLDNATKQNFAKAQKHYGEY